MTDPAEGVGRLRSFAEAYTAAWCSRDAARVASFYAEGGSLSVNDREVWRIGADGLIPESRGSFDAEDYRRQLEAPD